MNKLIAKFVSGFISLSIALGQPTFAVAFNNVDCANSSRGLLMSDLMGQQAVTAFIEFSWMPLGKRSRDIQAAFRQAARLRPSMRLPGKTWEYFKEELRIGARQLQLSDENALIEIVKKYDLGHVYVDLSGNRQYTTIDLHARKLGSFMSQENTSPREHIDAIWLALMRAINREKGWNPTDRNYLHADPSDVHFANDLSAVKAYVEDHEHTHLQLTSNFIRELRRAIEEGVFHGVPLDAHNSLIRALLSELGPPLGAESFTPTEPDVVDWALEELWVHLTQRESPIHDSGQLIPSLVERSDRDGFGLTSSLAEEVVAALRPIFDKIRLARGASRGQTATVPRAPEVHPSIKQPLPSNVPAAPVSPPIMPSDADSNDAAIAKFAHTIADQGIFNLYGSFAPGPSFSQTTRTYWVPKGVRYGRQSPAYEGYRSFITINYPLNDENHIVSGVLMPIESLARAQGTPERGLEAWGKLLVIRSQPSVVIEKKKQQRAISTSEPTVVSRLLQHLPLASNALARKFERTVQKTSDSWTTSIKIDPSKIATMRDYAAQNSELMAKLTSKPHLLEEKAVSIQFWGPAGDRVGDLFLTIVLPESAGNALANLLKKDPRLIETLIEQYYPEYRQLEYRRIKKAATVYEMTTEKMTKLEADFPRDKDLRTFLYLALGREDSIHYREAFGNDMGKPYVARLCNISEVSIPGFGIQRFPDDKSGRPGAVGTATGGILGKPFDVVYQRLLDWGIPLWIIHVFVAPVLQTIILKGLFFALPLLATVSITGDLMQGVAYGLIGGLFGSFVYSSPLVHPDVYTGRNTNAEIPTIYNRFGLFVKDVMEVLAFTAAALVSITQQNEVFMSKAYKNYSLIHLNFLNIGLLYGLGITLGIYILFNSVKLVFNEGAVGTATRRPETSKSDHALGHIAGVPASGFAMQGFTDDWNKVETWQNAVVSADGTKLGVAAVLDDAWHAPSRTVHYIVLYDRDAKTGKLSAPKGVRAPGDMGAWRLLGEVSTFVWFSPELAFTSDNRLTFSAVVTAHGRAEAGNTEYTKPSVIGVYRVYQMSPLTGSIKQTTEVVAYHDIAAPFKEWTPHFSKDWKRVLMPLWRYKNNGQEAKALLAEADFDLEQGKIGEPRYILANGDEIPGSAHQPLKLDSNNTTQFNYSVDGNGILLVQGGTFYRIKSSTNQKQLTPGKLVGTILTGIITLFSFAHSAIFGHDHLRFLASPEYIQQVEHLSAQAA